MNDPAERARELFFQGIAHFEAGRLEPACDAFEAALALAPGRPSILTNLGLTYEAQGKWPAAAETLTRALASDPQHPDLWLTSGLCRLRASDVRGALQAFDQAIEIAPDFAPAWSERGSLLRELKRLDEAARCFEKAIELGADPELHRFYLAAVKQDPSAAEPPRIYVETLFDDYAADFDEHLVGTLKYHGYESLVRPLIETGRRYQRVLDLGCGTGLSGKLLRGHAERLDGVDLSRAMLDRARQTGCYHDLSHADINEFLAATDQHADLVIAADVFIYLRDLAPIFHSVRRILDAGGCFAFTVELPQSADEIVLLPSLRHAHSEAYIRRLAATSGFSVRHFNTAPLRHDQTDSVRALYAYLE
ncbi:MAG: tetratricopeptide repeat protein [Rhodocyclaceae bacterium]|nr:tetratricopeptide repeat protein [Rhodocyclaceae bacterium]MDZ4215975.1 tetratricopeptide repeat protein [Rhodocyclaceae bacterium]